MRGVIHLHAVHNYLLTRKLVIYIGHLVLLEQWNPAIAMGWACGWGSEKEGKECMQNFGKSSLGRL
jgi:hypothetical protein